MTTITTHNHVKLSLLQREKLVTPPNEKTQTSPPKKGIEEQSVYKIKNKTALVRSLVFPVEM